MGQNRDRVISVAGRFRLYPERGDDCGPVLMTMQLIIERKPGGFVDNRRSWRSGFNVSNPLYGSPAHCVFLVTGGGLIENN